MIKQSVAEWCYYQRGDNAIDYYQKLKQIGFSGVEMAPPEHWAAAKEAGLTLVNIGAPGKIKGLNHKENQAQLINEIRQLIQVAHQNQIEHIIIFAGNREGLPDEQGLKNCITAGKTLAKDAEMAGVVLALELFNTFDHPDYQADHPAFAFDFAKAVSSPAVKVLYDIYHMARMGENLLNDLLTNLEFIAHLHIAGCPNRDFPGDDQEIDYRSLVTAVHQAGYRGFWGHEFLPGEDRFGELKRVFQLFQSYAS